MVELACAPECHAPLEPHTARIAVGHREEDSEARVAPRWQRPGGVLLIDALRREGTHGDVAVNAQIGNAIEHVARPSHKC